MPAVAVKPKTAPAPTPITEAPSKARTRPVKDPADTLVQHLTDLLATADALAVLLPTAASRIKGKTKQDNEARADMHSAELRLARAVTALRKDLGLR